MKRIKCIRERAYRGYPLDPELIKGQFYTVVEEKVYTMVDETPWISVSDGRNTYTRPRHMFGKILTTLTTKCINDILKTRS